MPRYYCDYCDTYLTHDSIEQPSVRKQHNAGYKHKANVRTYYQQFEEQQTQSLIDQRIKEHLGQAAAFQVGATFHQHLAAQRPRLPLLPTPVLPVPGGAPLVPGFRPPVLPRPPPGAPGYGAPPTMPQVGMPPVPSSVPMPMNGLPRPPTLNPPITSSMAPNPNGSAGMVNPAMYQAGPVATSGGYHSAPGSQSSATGGPPPAASSSQDGFAYSQTSEANH